MLIVLPQAADGLAPSRRPSPRKSSTGSWRPEAPASVALALPSLEVNPADSLALAAELGAMGMAEAFDRQRADFTGNRQSP